MQAGLDGPSGGVDDASAEPEDPAAVDGRSVYVGNVRTIQSGCGVIFAS